MIGLLIIAVLLIGVTGYIVWANQALKTQGLPTIEEGNRPVVQKSFFMEGLLSGNVTQQQIVPIIDLLSQYIYGDKQLINSLLLALLGGGHIIIQGQPGTGKTTLVRVLARMCDFVYARIQCTPDLLPQDVMGSEVFDNQMKVFSVHEGPIVANIVHVDEINRATPKLQAAFLEAMQEQAITIGGKRIELPQPFFVIATQNPYDAIGTYMLPYAQIDRFMISAYTVSLNRREEYRLLQDKEQQTLALSLPPVSHMLHPEVLHDIQVVINDILLSDEVLQHALACIHTVKAYDMPLSTRASKSLIIAAKVWAYLQGKPAVEKVDIDAVLVPVLKHRVSHLLGKQVDDEALYRIVTGVAQKDDIVVG